MENSNLNKRANTIQEFIGNARYDKEGQMIFAVKGGNIQLICDIRGWGAIQNLFADKSGKIDFDAAYKFQDELGEYIAAAINEKLKNISKDKEIEKLKEELEEANDTINDLRIHIKNP